MAQGDRSWGNKTALTDVTSIGATELFSESITIDTDWAAQVQVEIDASAAGDDFDIRIYTTLDAATEVWDNQPLIADRADTSNADPWRKTYVINGVYKIRFGFVRTAGAGTATAAIDYRKQRIANS